MFEGRFQPLHLIIILAIALIIFGPGKLPELGKGQGKSIREFKKAMSDTIKDRAIPLEDLTWKTINESVDIRFFDPRHII